MRTRIKLAAVMLSTIAGLSLTVVSCTPESTSAPSNADLASAAPVNASGQSAQYNWMGKYHNDALAFALGKIKSSKRVSKLDRCRVGLAALKDFQKAFRKSGGGSAVFDDLTLVDGMCESATSPSASLGVRALSPDGVLPHNDISYSANNYMNQIANQTDIAPSVLLLSFAVSKIQRQAEASLDLLESGAVGGTGSIAVSSAEYWDANESSWTDPNQIAYARSVEILPGNRVYQMSARTRRIIRADVMAAIGVLVYDWWMGEAALGKAAIKAAAASLVAGIFTT